MTSTDYIGIGVLITTLGGIIVNIINAWKLKGIEVKVDGAATVQTALISSLHDKLSDKDKTIADNKQVAAVLAQSITSKRE